MLDNTKERRQSVEVLKQERLKTANSVLENNMIVDSYITGILKNIFSDDGTRNRLMHGETFVNNKNLIIHLLEIKWLTLILLEEYYILFDNEKLNK